MTDTDYTCKRCGLEFGTPLSYDCCHCCADELVTILLAACVEARHALSVAASDAENLGGAKCAEAKFFRPYLKRLGAAIAATKGKE